MARADVLSRLGDLLANLDATTTRAAAEEHFRAALALQPDHGLRSRRPRLPRRAGRASGRGAPLLREGREARAGRRPRAVPLRREPDRRPRPRLAAAGARRPDPGGGAASRLRRGLGAARLHLSRPRRSCRPRRSRPWRRPTACSLRGWTSPTTSPLAYARTGQTAEGRGADRARARPQGDARGDRERPRGPARRGAAAGRGADRRAEARRGARPPRGGEGEDEPARRGATSWSGGSTRSSAPSTSTTSSTATTRRSSWPTRGTSRDAVAILEPLLTTTQDPAQVERARTLIERLRPPKKKGAVRSLTRLDRADTPAIA